MGATRSSSGPGVGRSGAESDVAARSVRAADVAAKGAAGYAPSDAERYLAAGASHRAHDAGLAALGVWRRRPPDAGPARRANSVRMEARCAGHSVGDLAVGGGQDA